MKSLPLIRSTSPSFPGPFPRKTPAPGIGQALHGTRHAREETHLPQQLAAPLTVEAQIVQLGAQGDDLKWSFKAEAHKP